MADLYVRTNGNDGGDGHDGTTAAKAWLTIGYAMTHATAGDTIWVGAGTYRLGAAIAPSSMASMTYLYGDVDGAKTGDAGEVVVTCFATNDTTAPGSYHAFQLSSKSNWTIGKLTIVGGGGANACVSVSGTSANVTVQDCALFAQGAGNGVLCVPTWGTAPALTVERCRSVSPGGASLSITLPASATGADYSLATTIRNCVLSGVYGVLITGTNNTYKAGGVDVLNCLTVGYYGVRVATSNPSTTYPCHVYNCELLSATGLSGPAAGALTVDWNLVNAATAYSNVTAGANDQTTARDWRFHIGQAQVYGGRIRPFGEPVAGSPLIGWGGTSVPTDDIAGITRPASGAGTVSAALGPYERSNTGTHEVTIVPAGGANSVKIAGPGYQDLLVAVKGGVAHTLTIACYADADYAGTKPSVSITNGGECGVADATATDTGSAETWNTLSIGPFTPTASGFVTLRLRSSSTAAAGNAYFGALAVS